MARKPRIEYEGAVYHVMNRGDRGGRIFKDRLDYELFITTMGEVCRRAGWVMHSYALMPNHFHWQVETPEANLVAGMKWFLGVYSQRFNNRHAKRGHVFQGRYKAVPIESESGHYFETLSTYIHLNPARARLLTDPKKGLEQHRWSSYMDYLRPASRRPVWLRVDRVLGNMNLEDNAEGRTAYRRYLRGRMRELGTKRGKKESRGEWKQIRSGWYAGSEEFGKDLLEKLSSVIEGKQRTSYSGGAIQAHDEHEAERLIRSGMATLEIDEADLTRLPKGHDLKCLLAWLAHQQTMASHAWLADRLRMGFPTALSAYIRRGDVARSGPLGRLRKRLKEAVLSDIRTDP